MNTVLFRAMRENMKKIFVFVLISGLFIQGTLQKSEKTEGIPRSFILQLRKRKTDDQNLIRTPDSTSPPDGYSLNNISTAYLNGPLSMRVIPITYLIVVTVGIPANITVLCLLITKVRKVSSALLYSSLAVTDLLLLLTLLFKASYHLHGNNWVLGEAACRVVTACFYGNLYCSALTLTCITLKRHLAVVHPFQYITFPKITGTAWAASAVWGVFGVAILPELLVQQSYWLHRLNRTSCHDVLPLKDKSHNFLLYYHLVLTILCILVPLVVTAVCFIRIIKELTRSDYDWAMYIKANSLVFGIFLVCFLPAGVLHFLHHVQLSLNGTDSLYVYFNVAVCLCCLHACLDPFLFFLMSQSTGTKLYTEFQKETP
nr:proteinase-activated receptor 3 [Nothobranchius furzeri]